MPTLIPAALMNRERRVAGVGEHVDAQVRKMHLAIGGDDAVRAGEHARVEQPRTVSFEQPEDAETAVLRGRRRSRRSPAHCRG